MDKDVQKDLANDSIEEYGIWVTSEPEPMEETSEEEILTVSGLNLQEVKTESDPYEVVPRDDNSQKHDSSTLVRITALEKGLSSLKTEVFNLKESIGELTKALKTSQKKENEEKPAAFFADDDSDETIALNVNELENILTTSEVTELNISAAASENATSSTAAGGKTNSPQGTSIDDSLSLDTSDVSSSEDDTILIIDDEAAVLEPDAPDSSTTDADASHGMFGFPDDEDEDESIILPESELASLSADADNIDADNIDIANIDIANINAEDPLIDPAEELSDEDLNIPNPSELGISDDEISSVSKVLSLDNDTEYISAQISQISSELRNEINSTVSLLKHILQTMPEKKIKEYENTNQFSSYKRLEQILSARQ